MLRDRNPYTCESKTKGTVSDMGPSKGFWGAGKNGHLFSRELGSTSNYFQEAGKQAFNFVELGNTAECDFLTWFWLPQTSFMHINITILFYS